jgi:ankyrin repeat protein
MGWPFLEEPVLPSTIWQEASNSNVVSTGLLVPDTGLPAIDGLSVSTYLSTSSLKKRLSHCSTQYLKTIALLKKGSISGSSAAATTGAAYSVSINASDISTIRSGTIRPEPVTTSRSRTHFSALTLPSTFLILDRYLQSQGFCSSGLPAHDAKTCWCLQDQYSAGQLWVHRRGLVNLDISDPPDNLSGLNIHFEDAFGNTVLHMLAVRGAHIMVMVDALKHGVDGNAKNTAGQNFLHLLCRRFLKHLAEDWNTLMWFLQTLNKFNVRFNDRDLFGRSFFHLLTLRARGVSPNALGVLSFLNITTWSSRDAFGWIPTTTPANGTRCQGGTRTYNRRVVSGLEKIGPVGTDGDARSSSTECAPPDLLGDIPLVSETSPLPAHLDRPGITVTDLSPVESLSTSDDGMLFKHARLLETAVLAMENASITDSAGRNGLQCLAEASLALDTDKPSVLVAESSKRKRDQKEPDALPSRLEIRYEYVATLIAAGVDVNNYDERGNTVLMAYVFHLHDGEDDKTLSKLLHHLIHSGANVNWRNRQGETALHMAVRLGRKVSTSVLLENGANVHARTAEGKGILATGEMHYFKAREKPALYASILACMALCMDYGAVPAPSLTREWEGVGRVL